MLKIPCASCSEAALALTLNLTVLNHCVFLHARPLISKRRKNISKFINKLLGSCTADFPTKGDLKRREISPCISRVVQCIPINPKLSLGTGHKVTARVGWSDLGWAMENLWAVSMGRQIFLYVHGWATKQKPMHVYFKK